LFAETVQLSAPLHDAWSNGSLPFCRAASSAWRAAQHCSACPGGIALRAPCAHVPAVAGGGAAAAPVPLCAEELVVADVLVDSAVV
jgi:hypothetical protein